MQRNVYVVLFISLVFCCSSSYSKQAFNAKPIFHENTIQAASFTKKINALQYQQTLQKKIHYPVRVITKTIHGKVFHRVIIGPMPSKQVLKMVAAQVYGSHELPPPQLHSNVVFQRPKNQISMRAAPLPKRVPSAQVNKKPNNKWALFTKNNEYSLFLGGTYLPNMISGQTLQLTPYEHGLYADTFTQQSDSGTFTWGLGLGHRYYISPTNKLGNLFDSFAINAQFFELIPSNQTGHVLQFGLAEFDNYTYQLGVSNYRFMADGDLDFDPIWNVVGFIEAGVGAASTTISYGSTPIAPVLDPGLKLNKKTNWSFAYQAGAGLKFPTFRHCELSLRYLYANMGTVNSSVNGSTDMLEKPLQVDMNTHNVLLGLSYKGDYIEK